ncbi:hypothetical protein ZIOFF_038610 [Zingiber officinale]|uniref:NAD(P)-binding domain-containing protein n=1 Tax=Zingiber officinale TaxID=94328 RepID=A0A8J5FZP3_ZINOF|nr:hypothetical protein ZIOFF_038610 [Zingiber officinale]
MVIDDGSYLIFLSSTLCVGFDLLFGEGTGCTGEVEGLLSYECDLSRDLALSSTYGIHRVVSYLIGNLLEPESLKDAMSDATSVISCVGGFGSPSYMRTLNGTANVDAVQAAAENGVTRFVYISAASFGLIDYCIQGYYDGQRATEAEIKKRFADGGQSSYLSCMGNSQARLYIRNLPNRAFEDTFRAFHHTLLLRKIPIIGPFFTPPVNVAKVAKVVVRGATDPTFPPGIVDVYNIISLGKQK